MIKIEPCLNGYLLVVGELRIVLSPEMHDELKSQFVDKTEEKFSETKPAKKQNKKPTVTKSKQWTTKYDRCQDCGTTEKKHIGGGFCSTCYHRNKNKKKTSGLKMKKYHCEDCAHEFESAADYLDVRCHECNGKRLLTL